MKTGFLKRVVFFICLFLLLTPLIIFAAAFPPGGPRNFTYLKCGGISYSPESGTLGTGQPVYDVYSVGYGADQKNDDVLLNAGELILRVVDLSIPGRGFPYQFVRTYKSRIFYNGPIGINWDHNYNMRLEQGTIVVGQNTGNMWFITGFDKLDYYVKNPDGSFTSPKGSFMKLEEEANGIFTLRDAEGMKYHFGPLGGGGGGHIVLHLLSIEDRNHNQMTFNYTNGYLTSVVDTLGRTITYNYTQGKLVSITDFDNRTVKFSYDINNDLVQVTSPVVSDVAGNGNGFPNGKVTKYSYISGFPSSDPRNHNLLTIVFPNEVPNGPAALTNTYGLNDFLETQTYGGTNITGVPAGGRFSYFYEVLNPGGDPNDLSLPRARTTVVDRVGNVAEYIYNVLGQSIRYREYTGRVNPSLPYATLQTQIPSYNNPWTPPIAQLRPEDPAFFETQYSFNSDGGLVEIIYPEGNKVQRTLDTANPNRFHQANILEERYIAGPRGGDGQGSTINDVIIKYVYEPIYNQIRMVSDPRGLDPNYVPFVDPLDTNVVGIDFDLDGNITSAEKRRARYTSVNTFDYQEGTPTDILSLAAAEGVVVSTALANDLSLAADINGNGLTTQKEGNLIRIQSPTVQLIPGSQQALIEGDTTQEITILQGYNSQGQLLFSLEQDQSQDEYKYYPEANPSGQGGIPASAVNPSDLGGYLGEVVRDTTTFDNYDGVALNLTTEYRYDVVGNINSFTNPRGVRTDYLVNELNQVVRTILSASVDSSTEIGLTAYGYNTTYSYDANDNLVQTDVQNKDGNTDSNAILTSTYTYDILNDLLSQTREVSPTQSVTTRYSYDANQNMIQVKEPLNNFHDTVFDERDLVLTATVGANDPLVSGTIRTVYNGNGFVKTLRDAEDTDGDGQEENVLTTYDGFDRAVRIIVPVGSEIKTSYDPASSAVEVIARGKIGGPSPTGNNTSGNVDLSDTFYHYDELVRVIQMDAKWFIPIGVSLNFTHSLGDGFRNTMTEYDRRSRLTHVVNENNHDAFLEYDGVDRNWKAKDALTNEVVTEFDNNSNVKEITRTERRGDAPSVSPETFITKNRYDSLNRLILTVDNLNQARRFAYDSRNNVTQTGDAQGPVDFNDPQFGLINRTGNTTRFFYDGLSRLTKTIQDLRIAGQGNGTPSLNGPTDPNIDPNNLDTSNPDNPDGKITENRVWDDNSRLLSVADDKNNTTTYEYDALNRLKKETFADNTTSQYTYDRDSNLKIFIDENSVTFTKIFDGDNRTVQTDITHPNIQGTTRQAFEYDGLSRLTKATDNNTSAITTDDSVVTSAYDSLAQLLEENQDGKIISNDYDGAGNRLTLRYPNNRIVSYTYDALERLKTVSGVVTNYAYIGPGRVLERTLANGAKLTYLDNSGADVGYDALSRIVQHRHETSTDSAITDFTYGHNRENMRTFEHRLHQPAGPDTKGEAYVYDSSYRLMNFKVGTQDGTGNIPTPDTQTAYNLDGVGNRTFINKDSTITNYFPNNMNEYDTVGSVNFVHDDNGNMTEDNLYRYFHDALDRLIKVQRKSDNADIAVYTYDAFNRRVLKTVTNSGSLDGSTRYLSDGLEEIEERDDTTNTVMGQYVYGAGLDEILSMDKGGQTYYFHDDSLGNVEALSDSAQNIVERVTYDAYGAPQFTDAAFNPTGTTSSFGNPFLYTGRRLDPETNFYYYRNRFYSPALGRFIERDPLGYSAGSLGLYEYVGGNAANAIDPMGLDSDYIITFYSHGSEEGGAWNDFGHAFFSLQAPGGEPIYYGRVPTGGVLSRTNLSADDRPSDSDAFVSYSITAEMYRKAMQVAYKGQEEWYWLMGDSCVGLCEDVARSLNIKDLSGGIFTMKPQAYADLIRKANPSQSKEPINLTGKKKDRKYIIGPKDPNAAAGGTGLWVAFAREFGDGFGDGWNDVPSDSFASRGGDVSGDGFEDVVISGDATPIGFFFSSGVSLGVKPKPSSGAGNPDNSGQAPQTGQESENTQGPPGEQANPKPPPPNKHGAGITSSADNPHGFGYTSGDAGGKGYRGSQTGYDQFGSRADQFYYNTRTGTFHTRY